MVDFILKLKINPHGARRGANNSASARRKSILWRVSGLVLFRKNSAGSGDYGDAGVKKKLPHQMAG
jgi:hypothetical protein